MLLMDFVIQMFNLVGCSPQSPAIPSILNIVYLLVTDGFNSHLKSLSNWSFARCNSSHEYYEFEKKKTCPKIEFIQYLT